MRAGSNVTVSLMSRPITSVFFGCATALPASSAPASPRASAARRVICPVMIPPCASCPILSLHRPRLGVEPDDDAFELGRRGRVLGHDQRVVAGNDVARRGGETL